MYVYKGVAIELNDRLTAPGVAEIEAATEALETALADLEGWIEESAPDYKPLSFSTVSTPEEIRTGMVEAAQRAYDAHEHIGEALSLAGIATS